MANILAEINDVLLDFINVNRTAHVLNGNEYWALERIAQIINKNQQSSSTVGIEPYDFD